MQTNNKPIGVAVVGYGYWSPKLIRNVLNQEAFFLAAICEKDESRHAGIREEYPDTKLYRHYREAFEDPSVEAVIVATIPSSHYRIAKLALENGKHVLVEKPLALISSDGEELARIAKEKNLVLMVDHTYVYAPAVEALRERIRTGELGKIYSVESTRANLGLFQRDTNVIWDLAPHDFSILLRLIEERPTHVTAIGSKSVVHPAQKRTQESDAHIVLTYASGMAAHVHVSWTSPVKTRQLTIVGSEKMALFDELAADPLTIFDQGVYPVEGSGESGSLFSYKIGESEPVSLPEGENLARMLADFGNAVRTGEEPRSGTALALDVVRLLAACEQSLKWGGRKTRVGGLFAALKRVFK